MARGLRPARPHDLLGRSHSGCSGDRRAGGTPRGSRGCRTHRAIRPGRAPGGRALRPCRSGPAGAVRRHDAPADAGAEREATSVRAAPARPELELGERERAGVVDERDRQAQESLERLDDRESSQPGMLPRNTVRPRSRSSGPGIPSPGTVAARPPPSRPRAPARRSFEHDAGPQLGPGRQRAVGHDPRRRSRARGRPT